MFEAIFLILAACIYVTTCWLTYSEWAREQWWYVPIGVALAALAGVLWFVAVKVFQDKQRMYVFNLVWDALVMTIYYGMPFLLFEVKINQWMLFGLALIVIGAVIVKAAHP